MFGVEKDVTCIAVLLWQSLLLSQIDAKKHLLHQVKSLMRNNQTSVCYTTSIQRKIDRRCLFYCCRHICCSHALNSATFLIKRTCQFMLSKRPYFYFATKSAINKINQQFVQIKETISISSRINSTIYQAQQAKSQLKIFLYLIIRINFISNKTTLNNSSEKVASVHFVRVTDLLSQIK